MKPTYPEGLDIEVVRRLRLAHPPGVELIEEEGEPASLIEAWSTVEEALVIDGVKSGADPGTLHRFDDASADPHQRHRLH